jgi:hypothetical protein
MLDYISDGSTMFEVVAVLVPALVLLWIILTVTALHKRDARFWSLGSTWTSVIACPIVLFIVSMNSSSQFTKSTRPSSTRRSWQELSSTSSRSGTRSSMTTTSLDR